MASYQPLLLLQVQKVQISYSCSVLVARFLWAPKPTQYRFLTSGFLDPCFFTHTWTGCLLPGSVGSSIQILCVSKYPDLSLPPKPSCLQRPGKQMKLVPIRYFPFPHHALRIPHGCQQILTHFLSVPSQIFMEPFAAQVNSTTYVVAFNEMNWRGAVFFG